MFIYRRNKYKVAVKYVPSRHEPVFIVGVKEVVKVYISDTRQLASVMLVCCLRSK